MCGTCVPRSTRVENEHHMNTVQWSATVDTWWERMGGDTLCSTNIDVINERVWTFKMGAVSIHPTGVWRSSKRKGSSWFHPCSASRHAIWYPGTFFFFFFLSDAYGSARNVLGAACGRYSQGAHYASANRPEHGARLAATKLESDGHESGPPSMRYCEFSRTLIVAQAEEIQLQTPAECWTPYADSTPM